MSPPTSSGGYDELPAAQEDRRLLQPVHRQFHAGGVPLAQSVMAAVHPGLSGPALAGHWRLGRHRPPHRAGGRARRGDRHRGGSQRVQAGSPARRRAPGGHPGRRNRMLRFHVAVRHRAPAAAARRGRPQARRPRQQCRRAARRSIGDGGGPRKLVRLQPAEPLPAHRRAHSRGLAGRPEGHGDQHDVGRRVQHAADGRDAERHRSSEVQRRVCVRLPQARADRAEPVLARHVWVARHRLLRDASRLGRHGRREAIAAEVSQDPAADPARCGCGRRYGALAGRDASDTTRTRTRVVRSRDPPRARLRPDAHDAKTRHDRSWRISSPSSLVSRPRAPEARAARRGTTTRGTRQRPGRADALAPGARP